MRLDLLAFGAHPDDVELFAGGTLAKMAALGYATGIVDITRGELGSRGTPAIRAREAGDAGRILGVKIRENLRLADGAVPVTPAARLKVVRLLRKYRPLIVLVHHWEDKHPDHTSTCRLVEEASHHAGLAKISTGQERYRPNTILYYKLPANVLPTLVVDISQYTVQRLAAIQAYRSQLFDPASSEPATYLSQPDFLGRIDTVQAYYGTLIGRSRGEGFLVKGSLEVSDPVAFFREHEEIRRR
jgi:bacillithiol biosynthesis deacetylase BshB1